MIKRAGAPLLLVLLAVLACHGRAVLDQRAGDQRVALGDAGTLSGPLVDEDLSGRGTWLAGPPVGDGTWRPAASLLYAAEASLFGPAHAAGFQATSLLLFLLLAASLVAWLVEAGLPPAVAALATGLLACHPASVEAVAYVPAQALVAATCLALLAGRLGLRSSRYARLGAVVAYVVVLLLEPVALVVPWLVWAVSSRRSRTVAWGWLGALGAWLVLRAVLPDVTWLPAARPLGEGLATTAGLVPAALGGWLLPHGLPYGTPHPLPFDPASAGVVLGAGLLLTAALLALLPGLLGPRTRAGLGGLVLGWLVLVPGVFVAEPLLFESQTVVLLPAAVLLVASLLTRAVSAGGRTARAAWAVGGVVLLAGFILAAIRHGAWVDDVTLESRALAERPEDVDTALRRFRALAAAGRRVEAWRAAGQAIEGRPLDGALRVEVADLVGAIAEDVSASSRVGLDTRRLRQVQALGYQGALDAFARQAGHLTGADRSLRAYALARQMEVAIGLGDLDLARSALELRLRLAHPEAAELEDAVAAAGWPARRDILLLALRALQAPPDGVPAEAYRGARARALAVADLDASQAGEDLLAPWVEAMEAVVRDMEADTNREPDPQVWLTLARVLDRLGKVERAAALRARAE
ncbi:MAG: hypothetical protein H6805_07345 [Planctomycetes bacterium]|nr:hypothetical protein [Planctomycetota bacterium]